MTRYGPRRWYDDDATPDERRRGAKEHARQLRLEMIRNYAEQYIAACKRGDEAAKRDVRQRAEADGINRKTLDARIVRDNRK